jgi:hypothetical protein
MTRLLILFNSVKNIKINGKTEAVASTDLQLQRQGQGQWVSICRDVVLEFGNGGFNHTSKEHAAGSNKPLKWNFSSFFCVIDSDEFKSSKCWNVSCDKAEDGSVFPLKCAAVKTRSVARPCGIDISLLGGTLGCCLCGNRRGWRGRRRFVESTILRLSRTFTPFLMFKKRGESSLIPG